MDIGSYIAGVFVGLGIAGVIFAYWFGEIQINSAKEKRRALD
jgi:hypothetical protein